MVYTVSKVNVLGVVGGTKYYECISIDVEVGDTFDIIEYYGVSPSGKFIDKSSDAYYHTTKINPQYLDFGKTYFLIYDMEMLDESQKYIYGDNRYIESKNLSVRLSDGYMGYYSAYELSKNAYDNDCKSFKTIENTDPNELFGMDTSEYTYYKVVKNMYERYEDLVQEDQQNDITPIILGSTLGVIILGIITVGIILQKRKTAAVPTDEATPTDEAPPEE